MALALGLAKAGAGDFLVLSWPGPEVPYALIEELKPAGVLLFSSNFAKGPGPIRALKARYPELLVFVDQEGGPFNSFRPPGVPRFPSAMTLGAADDPALTRQVAQGIGQEVCFAGADVDFAPVLDVNTNPKNPIIGIRSFGATPELVVRHGLAFLEGLKEAGVLATAKHFPGHGDTAVDSHLGLPVYKKGTLSEIETKHLPPFAAAVKAGVPLVMTAHILYEDLDPEYPATLSKKILTGLLREQMGFRGVIVTDDMSMRAIRDRYGTGEAAVRAVLAGADLVLAGRNPEAAREIHAALEKALEDGTIPASRLAETRSRLAELRKRAQAPCPEPDWEALEALALQAARAGVTWIQGELPIPGEGTLVVAPKLRPRYGEEPSLAELAPKYLKGAHYQVVSERPTGPEIEKTLTRARRFDRIVLGTYHWLGALPEEQIWLYEALKALGKPIYVVALGNPDDLVYLDPEPEGYLATYGFRAVQLRAALEALAGKFVPAGKLPVPVGPYPIGYGKGGVQ